MFYQLVFTLVLVAGILTPLMRRMQATDIGSPEAERLAPIVLYLHSHVWALAAGLMVVFTLHSIRLTHRVFGPLVPFSRALRGVAQGRVAQRLRLRAKDVLHTEAALFNAMSDALVERVNALNARRRALVEHVARLEALAARDADVRPQVDALRLELERMAADLAWFQCDDTAARPTVDAVDPALPASASPTPCRLEAPEL